MSVDSKLDAVRQHTGPTERDGGDSAGLLLGRLTVLPALLVLPFLLTSFPLLLLGWFKPVPVILLWLALTAAAVPYVWRRIPSVTGSADWGTSGEGQAKPTPRWVLWTLAGIAIVFGAVQAAYHGQFVIVQLDAASYMQFANWISHHGSLPIPNNAAAFGNAPGLTYASAAFYQVGSSIVPQFMAGLPMLLSLGFWAGGARVALFWAPVLGALGLFTFGGLVARLVGPRWAPLATVVLGIGLPESYTARNTYSETLAQILFLGALCLWIDAQRADRGEEDAGRYRSHWKTHARSASHVLAGVTGLLFGITLLVRIDGPADILLVVPYCGLLVLRRQRQVIALVAGLVIGLLYGAVDGAFLTRPYLEVNHQSVKYMIVAFALAIVVTAAAVWWLRRRGSELRFVPGRRLLNAVTVLPFVIIAAFLVRPYVERNWHALQYAPLSLHWIYWYAGAAAIVLGVIASAMIGRRCMKGEAPLWVLPLLTFAWAICWFLLRPAITPHQPYASRRLVPAVLPGLILLAVWLIAWLTRKSRAVHLVNVPAYLQRSPRVFVTAVCAAAIFLPPLIGNYGLGIKAGGLGTTRTYVGEVAAVDAICKAIPANSSVLIADYTLNQNFAQAIRGTCDVPVAGVGSIYYPGVEVVPVNAGTVPGAGVSPAVVRTAVAAIEKAGRHPFVIAPTAAVLSRLLGTGAVNFVMAQDTTIDAHVVFGTPRNTLPQRFTVYSWEPAK
ncbi:MAG TPA: hypothetical protein VHV09_23790 [Trebonia sp.]|nr:hypothetical protein [Trebonia sp.]